MKRYVTAILFLSTLVGYAHARPYIYLCIDKNGHKEYRNTNIIKGCKKVDLPYLTTIPAPVVKKPAAKKLVTPKKFPKVDDAKQKALDGERKQILQNELRTEEKKLKKLKKEYSAGQPERLGSERNYARYLDRVGKMKENIERTGKNIDALNREISKIK